VLPISRTSNKLLIKLLTNLYSKYTKDLLLKDIIVVEGFYINIISKARLKKANI